MGHILSNSNQMCSFWLILHPLRLVWLKSVFSTCHIYDPKAITDRFYVVYISCYIANCNWQENKLASLETITRRLTDGGEA